MDKAEKAIRNALLKIDASDTAIRKQIYKTAWEAHEISLLANNQLSQDECAKKRESLRQTIHQIEAEFQPDLVSSPSLKKQNNNNKKRNISQPEITVEPIVAPAISQPEIKIEPTILFEKDDGIETQLKLEAESFFDIKPEKLIKSNEKNSINKTPKRYINRKPKEKKRKKSLLFIILALLVILLLLIFLAVFIFNTNMQKTSTGLTPSLSNTSIQNIDKQNFPDNSPVRPAHTPSQNIAKNNDGFINILTTNNANNVATLGAASIDFRNENGTNYLRIFANSAEDAAIINIGEGALNTVRGKNILLDIDARSEGAAATQMSITCDLGQDNNCGRRRFNVPRYRDDIILQIHIPADSHGPAKLYLTSDVFGEGHAINIYAIRYKAVE